MKVWLWPQSVGVASGSPDPCSSRCELMCEPPDGEGGGQMRQPVSRATSAMICVHQQRLHLSTTHRLLW